MKQVAQRTVLVGLLGAFAFFWTFLMGLGSAPASTATSAEPGFSQVDAVVSGTGAQITYVDESRFPAVTAYLVANDQAGQPVLNLRKENFALTEDGAPVAITDFTTAGNQAATVVLVIDRSGSMADEAKLTGAQQAAISFVEHLQPGQDQAGFIAFSDSSEILTSLAPLTTAGKQTLISQIQGLAANGGTQFYQAVQNAITQFSATSGRKVVLALTDGLDDNGQAFLEPTVEAAQQANVAVYTIGLGSDVDQAGLRQLAEANGGAYYFSPSADQLEQLYLDIAGSLRNEYALTYQSATPNLDGTRRNLQVTLTTAGGEQIQTEGGYGVAGVLATSLNPALFFPLLIGLLAGLLVLYQLPQWRRRPTTGSEDAFAPSAVVSPVAPSAPPVVQPQSAPTLNVGAAVMPNPRPAIAPTLVTAGAAAQAPVAAAVAPTVAIRPAPVVTGGPALIQQLPLPAAETLVGSAGDCQLRLAHPSVKPHHAQISPNAGRYVLDDLSAGQTQVSFSGDPTQLRAIQRNALRDGSLCQLGEVSLTFRQPAAGPALLERRYALPPTGLTVGSDPACQVVLLDAAPRQARILQDGQRWVVEDLAGSGAFISYSGNPTQERPVAGRNALKAGSTLRVGTTILRLEL